MKKTLLFTFLVFSFFAFGQEVELKKGIIKLDNKEWGSYEGCGLLNKECSITNGKSEILLKYNDINLNGKNIYWINVKFLGKNKSFEIQDFYKPIIKTLIKNKVFNEDGSFNEERIDILIEKYGSEYSEKYIKNTTQIIINNN